MNRRNFIRMLSQSFIGAAFLPSVIDAAEPDDKRRAQFVFAQVKYRGGDWNPHPLSVTPLMEELMARTSVEAATAKREVTLADPDFRSIADFDQKIEGLPGGIKLDKVQAGANGVEIAVKGSNVRLAG